MGLPNLYVLEAGVVKRGSELRFRERAGDAPGPGGHVGAGLLVHVGIGNHVRDGKPATGAQHAPRLPDHAGLVAREVDHAVGDHDVDGLVADRYVLEIALEELDVFDAGVVGVGTCELEHLVGHVQADSLAGRSDAAGGDQHVSARARPKIEDGLALVQVRDRGGYPAAERRVDRGLGGIALTRAVIQRAAEHTSSVRRRTARAA